MARVPVSCSKCSRFLQQFVLMAVSSSLPFEVVSLHCSQCRWENVLGRQVFHRAPFPVEEFGRSRAVYVFEHKFAVDLALLISPKAVRENPAISVCAVWMTLSFGILSPTLSHEG